MLLYILVNFGGPRHLPEIEGFLKELLCDPDVIRTNWPRPIHNWLFRRIAKKRAVQIAHDYQLIGGRSPIYFDTEEIGKILSQNLKCPVHSFHRYLPATHPSFLQRIQDAKADEIRVLPLFPQFSFATTGSIARFLTDKLPLNIKSRLRWIRSYATHPAYIASFQRRIRDFLKEHNLREERTVLLFSAHGLPASFVAEGDPYQTECEQSYRAIRSAFPNTLTHLCYQSKFGPGEWLRPYTQEVAEQIDAWREGRSHIVFIPLSFTSDHIETLFEIEHLYLPPIRNQGLCVYRCPALNLEPFWLDALTQIACSKDLTETHSLVRKTGATPFIAGQKRSQIRFWS